jgi:hypothetical protein
MGATVKPWQKPGFSAKYFSSRRSISASTPICLRYLKWWIAVLKTVSYKPRDLPDQNEKDFACNPHTQILRADKHKTSPRAPHTENNMVVE